MAFKPKTETITFRLSKLEYAVIKAMADKKNQKVGTYVYLYMFGKIKID